MVILAGTNDIAGNTGPSNVKMITDNIFSMSEIAMSNGIKVVLSSILPVYEYEWAKEIMDPPSTIASINTKLKEYVKLNDLEYLDYHSDMVDERDGLMKEYSSDGTRFITRNFYFFIKFFDFFIYRNREFFVHFLVV